MTTLLDPYTPQMTAGHSSPLNDGASAVALASAEAATELEVEPLARVLASATYALDPQILGIAPAFAIPKAIQRAGLTLEQIDVWEVHESYASVALAILRELPNQLDGFHLPDEKLNPNGGAVAIGQSARLAQHARACRFLLRSLDALVEAQSNLRRNDGMRVMVLIKATEESEAGVMPSQELLTQMGNFNEELVKSGVMLAGDGLHPSSKGVRVAFSGSERKVIDGPFAETKELLAGYWLWQVKSLDEAIEWVKRVPDPMPGSEAIIEIRPVFEAEDFGEEFTPELREQEARLREQAEANR